MTTTINFNRQILNQWLDRGLCLGAGDGKTKVCVEQAVALSLGYELTDRPEAHENNCIAPSVAEFKRKLNDCWWSSDVARSDGLKELAYEQLGSRGIDEIKFTKCLAQSTIQQLLPKLFRQIAGMYQGPHKMNLLKCADDCEKEGTEKSARAALTAARTALTAAWLSSAWSAARATVSASEAVSAIASEAVSAIALAAARAAWSSVQMAAGNNDEYLILIAKLALRTLRESKKQANIPLFDEMFPQ